MNSKVVNSAAADQRRMMKAMNEWSCFLMVLKYSEYIPNGYFLIMIHTLSGRIQLTHTTAELCNHFL